MFECFYYKNIFAVKFSVSLYLTQKNVE